mgnify:FL=1
MSAFERFLLDQGAKVAFPRITDRESCEMEFAPARSGDAESWTKGAFGIQEPAPHVTAWTDDSLQIVCVPGVEFGEKGERKGRGVGFYDRYLSRSSQATRVGIAWDAQIKSELKQNKWDQLMDWIVTESRVLRCRRGQVRS